MKEISGSGGSLGPDDLKQACKNIGFDLTCGACASLFYTGYGGYPHEDDCTSTTGLTHEEALVLLRLLQPIRGKIPERKAQMIFDSIMTSLERIANR